MVSKSKTAPKRTVKTFVCPECEEAGIKSGPFRNIRALNSHRHYRHGYQGIKRVRPEDMLSAVLSQLPVRELTKPGKTMKEELNRLYVIEAKYKDLLKQLEKATGKKIAHP